MRNWQKQLMDDDEQFAELMVKLEDTERRFPGGHPFLDGIDDSVGESKASPARI
jgi:hypothetical protein